MLLTAVQTSSMLQHFSVFHVLCPSFFEILEPAVCRSGKIRLFCLTVTGWGTRSCGDRCRGMIENVITSYALFKVRKSSINDVLERCDDCSDKNVVGHTCDHIVFSSTGHRIMSTYDLVDE